MEVAVSGASGLIGTALRERLETDGHRVVPLVRGEVSGPDEIRWDPYEGKIDAGGLEGLGGLVHLSGARIRAGRWTPRHRRAVLESRTRTTRLLATTLAGLDRPPPVMASGSAIGFYGSRGDDELTEETGPGDGFLADLCMAWEAATAPAEAAGVRVVHLRSGLVLSGDGGLLDPFIMPGKLAVAGRLGSGQQWMSWISIDDEARAIAHVLTSDLHGPVNLTGPNPVRNREFVDVLADVVRRPKLPPVPAFAVRLVFGRMAADEAALTSQRVRPTKLETDGFVWEHRDLEPALRAVLER